MSEKINPYSWKEYQKTLIPREVWEKQIDHEGIQSTLCVLEEKLANDQSIFAILFEPYDKHHTAEQLHLMLSENELAQLAYSVWKEKSSKTVDTNLNLRDHVALEVQNFNRVDFVKSGKYSQEQASEMLNELKSIVGSPVLNLHNGINHPGEDYIDKMRALEYQPEYTTPDRSAAGNPESRGGIPIIPIAAAVLFGVWLGRRDDW